MNEDGKILWLRDIQHGIRVAAYLKQLTERLDINQEDAQEIYLAALFHDIGKAYINAEILNKTGKLNKVEYAKIKLHAKYSVEILNELGFSLNILRMVLYHHENMDGTGYERLPGDKIPLGSKIIRICDVFDALTSTRTYRRRLTSEEALTIMNKERHLYD